MKRKEQTIHVMHDFKKKSTWKTTFAKHAKEILGVPNPKSIACIIKKNVESQMEEMCFERKLTLFFRRCFRIMVAGWLHEIII